MSGHDFVPIKVLVNALIVANRNQPPEAKNELQQKSCCHMRVSLRYSIYRCVWSMSILCIYCFYWISV